MNIDFKTIALATGARLVGGYIGEGAKYLYDEYVPKDSFLGSSVEAFRSNKMLAQTVKQVTTSAIKEGIVPNYLNTPTQERINPNLGKIGIGTTRDFEQFTPKRNLLATGTTGKIEEAMRKTGVKQFYINEIATNYVNPTIGLKRGIGLAPTPLGLGKLKRGQIVGAD